MPPQDSELGKHDESKLFRLLAKNVKDYAIFVVDVEGRVQTWSEGSERLLGFSEQEIIGRPCELFFSADDVRQGVPRQERDQALATGRGEDDRWHVRKDGTRFWSSGVTTPLFDEAGALCGFAKIMRDRTSLKRAEEALAVQSREADRRRRLYEAALSNTPDLVYVFDLDHRFAYVNEGLLTLWGRTWEEAIGKTCLELGYEPWHAAMHDLEIEQVVATRQPVKGEVPFTGAFGRRIYEYIFVPVLGENGEVEAVAGTTRDVTDRRASEQRVRQSEERFRSLMEQSPLSIQIFSPDGRTLRVNRAWEQLWDIPFDQLAQYNVLEDRQLEAKGILPYIRQGFAGLPTRIPAIEYDPRETLPDAVQSEDPRRWISAVIYPIKDSSGAVQEVVLIHEDVTARHRAEEALREADRRKDEFLATLAHELRNPLAPIRNALQILEIPRVDAAVAGQARQMMQRQVHHLVRLVDDLLDVSRVMRGKIELRKERIELATIIARAIETVQPLIESQEHRLEISLPTDSLLLEVDPVRLVQVVGNLLTNAAKYTEPQGCIWLTARREQDYAVLSIRDNGIGLAPEMLSQVFELFVQADHADYRGQGGLGIGLTLVRNLVEMHEGRVDASSPGLGQGSEFVVRLPLLKRGKLELEQEASGPPPPQVRSSGRRLLVVDDNHDAALSLAMLLRLKGHDVRVAHEGAAALESAAEYSPDMIFLDLGMPGMSGYEAARRIRQMPGLRETLLVALTGWGQQEDRRRTAEAGFDLHLIKPADARALEDALARLPRD
jgi:PAS domain S-box-containing protein